MAARTGHPDRLYGWESTIAVEDGHMSDQRDLRIAQGLRAGSSEAWAALYEAYFDRVWQLAARAIGPHAADVADVVQETFLGAARSARTYDVGRGSLWSWLGGVVRNQVGNYFRNKSRAGRLQQGGDLHPAVSGTLAERLRQGTPSPQGGPIAAEEAAIVRATLAGLPEDYQSLLAARYFEGVSIEEMARIGNCTASAVRSKLARARRGFREAYMRVLAFEGDGSGNTP